MRGALACWGLPQSPKGRDQNQFNTVLHRSMSCPAQLCNRSALLQSFSSIAVEHRELPRLRTSVTAERSALRAEEEETDEEDKSAEYSDVMQQRMGSSLTYRHEDGMNYAEILENLVVGSCLQTPEDVDRHAFLT